MARPERRDADYFPFYCRDGKTLFILESKYQCKGTGFFTNVMRFLTLQTDHHVCIQEDSDRLYFFSKVKCDEESGMDMLNLMAMTGKIDRCLWDKSRCIVSKDLLDSLKDAYRQRRNQIITLEQIRVNHAVNEQNIDDNPTEAELQAGLNHKGKERKGKERKGKKEERVFFQKPSLEEVSKYCLERKNGIDPQVWLDHYTSNGWMVGKNKMKDWRAAVRTWESREWNNGNSPGKVKRHSGIQEWLSRKQEEGEHDEA